MKQQGPSMKIELNLFSLLRKYSPRDETIFELELSAGSTTGQLLETLEIPSKVDLVILVNGRQAQRETRLADGDKVTLFPPMAGG